MLRRQKVYLALPALLLISLVIVFLNSPKGINDHANTSLHALDTYDALTGPMQHFFDSNAVALDFAESAHRLRFLSDWINAANSLSKRQSQRAWADIELFAEHLLPFIHHANTSHPLQTILHSHHPNTRGIVITAGLHDFHFLCHLLSMIHFVHHSNLQVEIAFGGESDLPATDRAFISNEFSHVTFVNVLQHFDNTDLSLETGRYAIKPFAVLASSFQEVLLLDADTVLMQAPEALFDLPGYDDTGAYLFKDRAVWPCCPRFRDEWWQTLFRRIQPSDNIMKSRAVIEGFSEHGESGVVLIDKGKLGNMMSLLHICWQNSFLVRENVTYKSLSYGDKESWWLGFEALNQTYTMEDKYAVAAGFPCPDREPMPDDTCVETSYVAHVDRQQKLLWYNASLRRNKKLNESTYEVMDRWMEDGQWITGNDPNPSQMINGKFTRLRDNDTAVLVDAIRRAEAIDALIRHELPELNDPRFDPLTKDVPQSPPPPPSDESQQATNEAEKYEGKSAEQILEAMGVRPNQELLDIVKQKQEANERVLTVSNTDISSMALAEHRVATIT